MKKFLISSFKGIFLGQTLLHKIDKITVFKNLKNFALFLFISVL